MSIRHITPALRIGQRTTVTREIQLLEAGHDSAPLDLSGAESVTLTLEHYEFGFTAVQDGTCTIVNPQEGIVSYTFDQRDTSLHGRYSMQFEVDYGAQTELVPPSSDEWVMDIGRRQPSYQPLEVPSITADEGVFGSLQADSFTAGTVEIGEIIGDPTIDSFSMNTLDVGALSGGIVGTRGPLTRIDGPDLQVNANGELEWVDPNTGGFTAGSDHDHSVTGEGGDMLRPTSLTADKIQTSRAETAEADSATFETIYLESDTYTVNSTIDLASNTRINGQGATIQIADLADFHGGVFTIGAVSDVVIEDVTIDLNRAGASTTTSHVYNLGIFSSGASTAENITLRDVTIKNGVNRGIALYHCDNVTFDNVRVEYCDEGCVEIDHGCRSVTVTDSEFRNPIGFGVRVDASADSVNAVSVTDSHFEDIAGTGVHIAGTAQQACKINDNTFVNVSTAIQPGEHSTANNNTIHRCDRGIESGGSGSFVGNTFSAIVGLGRSIRELEGDSLIANNTVLGGESRIETSGSNVIVGNVCKHVNHWGIQVHGDGNTIADNKIFADNSSTTLAADAAAGATTVQLTANPFIIGSRVNIGGETKYIVEHLESAANGTANVVELDSGLAGGHLAGTAVTAELGRSTGIHFDSSENRAFNNEYPTRHSTAGTVRNIIDGRSATSSPPTQAGSSWNGHEALAEKYDVTVVADFDKQYKAVDGKWQRINSWFEIDSAAPATPLNYSVAGLGNYDEIKIELDWYIDRGTVDTGNFLMRFNDDAGSKYVGRMLSTTGFDTGSATEFTIAEGEGFRSLSAEIIISNQPRASVHADVSHSTNRVLHDGWVNDFAVQVSSVQIWESGVTSPGGALQNPRITVKGRNH